MKDIDYLCDIYNLIPFVLCTLLYDFRLFLSAYWESMFYIFGPATMH